MTSAAKYTMLVVDDVVTNIDILCQILSPLYHVKAATSGARALSIVASDSPPDLILLDVMMPDMDGYELCRQIKANPTSKHIPIIFVTSMEEEKHEEFGLSLGAQDYITKPFRAAIVLARVSTQLALYANARELEKHIKIAEQANLELRTAMQELEVAHAKIAQAEHMTALGAMVAGIAHELNTPIGNCTLAASALDDKNQEFKLMAVRSNLPRECQLYSDDLSQGCAILLRNLNRASELITEFKQLAANQNTLRRSHFDLAKFILNATAEFQHLLQSRGITLHTGFISGMAFDSYPSAIHDVIQHLMKNALLHAFVGEAPGDIHIVLSELPSGLVQLRFSDNGVGISADHLTRVFDPFFTTKFGIRSGLGLNIVYNLVSYVLGGEIRVESVPPGCSFIITLPRLAPLQGKPVVP